MMKTLNEIRVTRLLMQIGFEWSTLCNQCSELRDMYMHNEISAKRLIKIYDKKLYRMNQLRQRATWLCNQCPSIDFSLDEAAYMDIVGFLA